MSGEPYQPTLEVDELLTELKRLLAQQRQTDRLVCRYLADLADGIAHWPGLPIAYGDVYNLVRHKLGLSIRSIRERIRVGRALRELPGLEQALVAGNLTYSRVREVTRVAQPKDEAYWLSAACELSMRKLEQLVSQLTEEGGETLPPLGPCEEAAQRELRLKLPTSTWDLLQEALRNARQASDRRLTNAEALGQVLRAAVIHQEEMQGRPPPPFAPPLQPALVAAALALPPGARATLPPGARATLPPVAV